MTLEDFEQERARGVLNGGVEFRAAPIEVRAGDAGEGPGITGYGSVANQSTRIEGFFSDWDEEVAPEAWSKTIAESPRIMSMFNHDPSRLLGSTDADTLRLSEDEGGLVYDVDINPDDPMAMSVHAQVQRGDVHGSSVWFQVVREEITQPDEQNGLERPLRRITEGKLFEAGPVTWPAFEQTTSMARSAHNIDAVLRGAGMQSASKRSALIVATLTNPHADLEHELRGFREQNHEIFDTNRAAAAAAPGSDAPPEAGHPSSALIVARARLTLLRRPAA